MDYILIPVSTPLHLEDFAKQYEIESKFLLDFHNKRCKVSEMLSLTISRYVEFIYFPLELYTDRQEKLLEYSTLKYPEIIKDKEYGILSYFHPQDLKIHYKIKLKKESLCVEIQKDTTYINDQETEKTVEKILEKAEQSLFPLMVSVNANGGINKVENSKDISVRWNDKILPKLNQYYQSETANNIFRKINNVLQDINNKKEFLYHQLFYKLYFLEVYRNYEHFSLKKELSIFFPTLKKEILYEVEFKLLEKYSDNNNIHLTITGQEKLGLNENDERGKFNFLYSFHRETHEIFSIVGFASTYAEKVEQKIEFEMYELKIND